MKQLPLHYLTNDGNRVRIEYEKEFGDHLSMWTIILGRKKGSYSIKRRIDPTLNAWELLPKFGEKEVKLKIIGETII